MQAEDLTGDGDDRAEQHRGGQLCDMRNASRSRQDVEIGRQYIGCVHGEKRDQRVNAKPAAGAESPLSGNLSVDGAGQKNSNCKSVSSAPQPEFAHIIFQQTLQNDFALKLALHPRSGISSKPFS